MDRSTQVEQSKNKILTAARQEFGAQGYVDASVGNMSANGAFSKGLIYHYFKSKEELYLYCVREVFEDLGAYLLQEFKFEPSAQSVAEGLNAYFAARLEFFRANPVALRLFYTAVVTPPRNLAEGIKEARAGFDEINTRILRTLLSQNKLRPGLSLADVIETVCNYQDYLHNRYQLRLVNAASFSQYEQNAQRFLYILLFGILE